MRKLTNLAIVSLACTLAAFGCTMNRMTGNGQSTEQTPEIGPANTSSTVGSSSGMTNPPMASGAIVVDPTRPSAVDAQATLAADQGYQGRVLGVTNPQMTTQSNAQTAPTGQFVNPALIVNPQSTVNSSISSAVMAPGLTGGPVGGGVGVAGAPPAVPTVPMSGDATDVTGTLAAATNSAIASSSNSAVSTASSSALVTAPAATSTTSRVTTTSTTAKTAKATTKAKSAKRTVKAAAATTAQPVQIQTTANGDVVMTNTTNPPQQ
jgi:hypothetical protein